MEVLITSLLRSRLAESTTLAVEDLISSFAAWKHNKLTESYYYGKDGLNRNSTILRHVHLPPCSDEFELQQWDRNWTKYRGRTSDRYLFYVDRGLDRYLLLYIVDDPGAHTFLSEPNQTQLAILKELEDIADLYFYSGKVSC